ncbi:MAG TPA: efflux RND transporter periplasmic adaptor subunit [Candidatus Aminicenantes bacterium]|nr:efflux RND transporter periplasmic adaptor subunit [Candidatus Aminicenantes bacterium]HRY63980.1 efflux RND transporter periplasmic adaptor subunit [Candidatus Aminicenantes bacterium]HRZ70893.1 efflux RND transporter periplasmic adaptor subunit [Candidatus Aminicenantes bacterium]
MTTPQIARKLALTALAAAVIAAGGACRKAAQPGDAAQTFGAAPVKVFKAARERITEKITYTGTLEALNKINITPETGGKIARICVEAGDRVAKGQLLAELETESIRLQLKQAEAGVAVAEAAYADALKNKERMDRLIKEQAVSEQQREKIQLAFDAASAQLEQARAALNLARHALDVSLMTAPFAGVIASKNAEVGDVINPMMGGAYGGGAGGVLTLMDYSTIKLAVAVSPENIGRIRKGQDAVLKVGALPGREFRGVVRVVNLTADPQTKKFEVEVHVPNPEAALRPGTFGDLVFEVQSHDNALVVPQTAVLENTYVYVVEGGKAVRKNVTLGIQNTTMIEILGGLADQEAVVVEGNYGLEAGAAVQVLEEVKK